MFTVLVLPLPTAPVDRFVVELAVLEYPKALVVAPAAIVRVIAFVSNTENEELPVVIDVVKFGEVPNTFKPVPVLVVSADNKLALEGAARKVATPLPRPVNEPTAATLFVALKFAIN
jgi:hypothetical protein